MQLLVVNPAPHHLPSGAVDLLSQPGWELLTATDYQNAVDVARSQPIDVVIVADPGGGGDPIGRTETADSCRLEGGVSAPEAFGDGVAGNPAAGQDAADVGVNAIDAGAVERAGFRSLVSLVEAKPIVDR